MIEDSPAAQLCHDQEGVPRTGEGIERSDQAAGRLISGTVSRMTGNLLPRPVYGAARPAMEVQRDAGCESTTHTEKRSAWPGSIAAFTAQTFHGRVGPRYTMA